MMPADQEALDAHIGEYDAYLASMKVRLTREVITRAPRLRVVVTPSTGLDHLDLEAMRERGIALLSLKEETDFLDSVTATAEMAWTLMLAVARRLPWAFDAAKRGHWSRDAFRGRQLSGKTLGILGYGRLGRIMSQYARGFRMNVIAADVRAVEPEPWVRMVDVETLLREADVLSIHIHLTDENRGFLNAQRLAMMKPGSFLVNTSRGAIIDEAALRQALEHGPLAGAGLDVIDGEWRPDMAAHPLIAYAREHENLVISPHLGGVTFESQAMTYRFIVGKLFDWFEAQGRM